MTWFRVDDGFMDHPKVVDLQQSVTPARFSGALTLWLAAGLWCARNLSDGVIPAVKLKQVAPVSRWKRAALDLVSVGLWARIEPENGAKNDSESYSFHDWHTYQPSAAKVREQREKDAEKKRRMRAGKKDCPQGTGYGTPTPRPALPDPVPDPIEEKEENAGACPPGVDPHAWRFAEHLKTKPLIVDALGSEDVVAKASEWLGLTLMNDWGVAAAIEAVDSEHKTLRAEDTPSFRLRGVTRCLERLQRDARNPEKRRRLMGRPAKETARPAAAPVVTPPGELTPEQERAVASVYDFTGNVLSLIRLQGEAMTRDTPASFEEFKQRRAELAQRMRGARDVPA